MADLWAVDFLDAAVPSGNSSLAWYRQPGAELRHRPGDCRQLRRNAPDLPRPFRVRAFGIIGPISFMISALIVYWSGWNTLMVTGAANRDVCRLRDVQGKVSEHTVSRRSRLSLRCG